MLHSLGADDERFKTLRFRQGMNLLVADRTRASRETDSRNGAGKSSTIELLHFLLGAANSREALWAHRALSRHRFELVLDWPGRANPIKVQRRAAAPGKIYLQPDVSRQPASGELFEPTELAAEVPLRDWQWTIERDLYGLESPQADVSGRTLLSFAMRRVNAGGFLEATTTFARQSTHEAMVNLCFLFGLDVGLAAEYRILSAQEATRKKLAEAAKDPVWGKIVGRSADLRGEIGALDQRVAELSRQIAEFRVVPEYENLREEADELGRLIRESRDLDEVDRRNLQDMRQAAADSSEPDDRYLEEAFEQLHLVLGAEVRRRFDEVRVFHHTVVSNREKQLREETERLEERLAARAREREQLGDRQAVLLTTLASGGALDALTAMQSILGHERAQLDALRNRFQAAQALEASQRDIRARRLTLVSAMNEDLGGRAGFTREANRLFSIYARRLYGDSRAPYLSFDPGERQMRIEAKIDADGSRGIHNMVIFCFDLALAVIAHRGGRGPDFLVHDSHLFDGVDERQVIRALELAAEVSAEEELQYIASMNSDDLAKASGKGFRPDAYVIEPRLTDQADGGLFGFQF